MTISSVMCPPHCLLLEKIARKGAQEKGENEVAKVRSGQEQCKSRTGALYLYLLPVSAPCNILWAEAEQGRLRAGAG